MLGVAMLAKARSMQYFTNLLHLTCTREVLNGPAHHRSIMRHPLGGKGYSRDAGRARIDIIAPEV